jgi:hypothetical protein
VYSQQFSLHLQPEYALADRLLVCQGLRFVDLVISAYFCVGMMGLDNFVDVNVHAYFSAVFLVLFIDILSFSPSVVFFRSLWLKEYH